MSDKTETINRHTVAFQLNEALEAIDSTIRSMERGRVADLAIWVLLGEVLDHLCLAWHRKRLHPEEVMQESQEDYELKAVSVPNWAERFRLVDLATTHPAIDPRLSHRKIAGDTVCTYLRTAEMPLRNLIRKIGSGEFDSCEVESLGDEFVPILRSLCLAWHLRNLSDVEICSLDRRVINEVGSWLPRWKWDYRLVPSSQPWGQT